MKRLYASLFLLVIVAGLFAGCSNKSDGVSAYLSGSTANLDPLFCDSPLADSVVMNCFEGLLVLAEDGTIGNGCAETYTVSADGLIYTFTLKENLTWSDGSALSSDDFLYTFERMFSARYPSALATQFDCLNNAQAVLGGANPSTLGVSAPDDRTVVFTLERPNALFPGLIASKGALPCNREFFASTSGKYGLSKDTLVFNGAFRITYQSDTQITLRPNPSYQGNASVLPDVVYLNRDIDGNGVDEFSAGRTDLCIYGAVHSPKMARTDAQPVSVGTTTYSVLFNASNDYFKSKNLRTALMKGLSRDAFEGTDSVAAARSLVPSSVSVGTTLYATLAGSFPFPAYDVEGAKSNYAAALGELGLYKIPSLTLLVEEGGLSGDILPHILQAWQKDLGFYINMVTVTPAEMAEKIAAGDFDAALVPLSADYDSPLSVLSELKQYGLAIPGFDALLDRAVLAGDAAQLVAACLEAERLIAESALLFPVYCESTSLAAGPSVKGLRYPPNLRYLNFQSATK